MHKKITIDHTPSFTQNNSLTYDAIVDSGYDFSDDLIDEHVAVPAMASPRENLQYESLCRVLKSIENIQNTNMYNNQTDKYLLTEDQNTKSTKILKKNPDKASHFKSTFNYETAQSKASNLKASSSRFEQNINQHLLKKQKKIKDLKQILQNQEMKQCTFTPNTALSGKDKTPKRNLDEFLKNQSEHVNKISKKRQDLKKKTQQLSKLQQSFRPKINKTTNQIDRNRNKKPAHERLYELKQNKSMRSKLITEQNENKSKVKPKCEQTRNVNKVLTLKTHSSSKIQQIDCPLYQDAERRNNLLKSLQKSKQSLQKIAKPTSKNNQKYGAQKFIKQFCYVLECMKLLPSSMSSSIEPEDEYNQNQDIESRQFNFSQFYGVMKGLGFLMYEQNCQNELAYRERSLAFEGFEILQQYGVNIRNLCVFLLSVLGIYNVNPVNFYDSNQQQRKKYQFEVNEKQGRKLHKYFDLLYCNYLTSRQKKSTVSSSHNTSTSAVGSNFISPRHDQHTKQLATKYRTKMIERANERFISNNIDIVLPTQNNMLTHQDLLVIDRLGKNLEMKKLREDKNSYVDQECTFYPKVNHNSSCLTQRDRERGQQKSQELYQHAKTKQKLDRNAQFISDCKSGNINMHGLSQHSQISKQHSQSKNYLDHSNVSAKKTAKYPSEKRDKQVEKSGNQCVHYAKDVDKAVARMTLGRKQRQLKNKLLQRGQPDYSTKKIKAKSPNKPCHTISSIEHNPHSVSTRTLNNPQTQREASVHQFHHLLYQDSNNNEPFLVIDINMGSQIDQIQFYTGDEKKVGKIVDQFCADHDLDDECKEQLLELVEIEMLKYLNNIGAESTQC